MFTSFKKFLNDALADLDKKVDNTLTPIEKKVSKPLQEQLQQVLPSSVSFSIDIEKSKRILTTIKEETVKAYTVGSSNIDSLPVEFYRDNVNLYAGLELIEKYEQDMNRLQAGNKALYVKAHATDAQIGPVFQVASKQREAWVQFTKDVNVLSTILVSVTNVRAEVERLCDRVDQLEMTLTEQLEAVASVEVETWKEHQKLVTSKLSEKHQKDLVNYEHELRVGFIKREQQRLEVEKLKLQLELEKQRIGAQERERLDKLREMELALERQKEEARMRQQLEQQFQKDIDAYKAYGTLPSKPTSGTQTLEQVELPLDPSVEDFLGPPVQPDTVPEPPTEEEDDKPAVHVLPVIESPESPKSVKPAPEKATKEDNVKQEDKVEDVDESWYT